MMMMMMMIVMTKGIITNSKLNHRKRSEVFALKFGWIAAILLKNCFGLRQNC